MEWEITVVDQRGRTVPVVVATTGRPTVGQLREELARLTGAARQLYLDNQPLVDTVPLAESGLVAGAVVRCAASDQATADPTDPADGTLELAVVGGLGAGARLVLPAGGRVVVGRDQECDLRIADPEVSRRHAQVRTVAIEHGSPAGRTDPTSATIEDLGSQNGTARHGYRLAGPVEATPDDVFRVGETLLAVRPARPADAHTSTDASNGVVWFNRPPRIRPPEPNHEVTVPAAPERPRGFRFPLALVLMPLLAAGLLYAFLPGSPYFLVFLALSPLMALAHFLTERRGGTREYRDKRRQYETVLAQARVRLAEIAADEQRATRAAQPDPAAVVHIATGPAGRLYERRPGDPDFLRLRVGTTDRPARVRLTGPGAADASLPTVSAAPSAVELAEVGVLGVAGPRAATLSIARAVLAHAATLHAPHDLGLVVLAGVDAAADWQWASWLPHTVPHRAELACQRLVATDGAQAEARLAGLRRIVDERRAEQRASLRAGGPAGRRILLVVDGARRLRDLPGLAGLLADGPDAGVYALCLDTTAAHLPDECRSTVVATSSAGTRVRVSRPDQEPDEDVLADGLPLPTAERLARSLAPTRVLGARLGEDEGLPDSVRYLDLAGVTLDPAEIAGRWAGLPGGHSTRALLGAGVGGPVEVDLRRDGPHALIAGTSGAGKSELLQTLVASLALGNQPDALTVVLVDYKGGSAFAECRHLPHCVGMVTDLDGHLVNRALASLSAELRRRETILAGAGAKDIEDYLAAGGRLARLVIVVDEFASLVEEVPEFVSGVVGIGMRGRSLGVHVVLATQRPAGVVNAELRANLNLRLSLRVTNPAESVDVIDVPDAARISRHHPGRAYLRTGHSDLVALQCARIGWPQGDPARTADVDTVRVRPRRMAGLGRPVAGDPAGTAGGHDGDTDLTALVAAVQAAAAEAGVRAPASPWLPPLPARVTVAELAAPADTQEPAQAGPVCVPLGLADHPAQQAQPPYLLDLAQAAPVVVAGMARSGRSTALRTLAAQLAAGASPADVHIYLLDYGGRMLAPLARLPHVGAWVDAAEADRVERLLALLATEVTNRHRLLATSGHGSLREQRAAAACPGERLPYLLLLLDQYETFLARHEDVDGGRLVESIEALLRNGPAVGILPVLATDRSGFGSRLAGAVPTRVVLRQADPDQLSAFGLHPREVPGAMPPGRAIVVPGAVEVQLALLDADPDGAAQTAAVERLSEHLAARWDGLDPAVRPRRVDPLPEAITMADLTRAQLPSAPAVCIVGAGGDQLGPVPVDLAETGGLLVAGPPGSGRSTALAAAATSLAGWVTGAVSLVIACPRPSPLAELAGRPGVVLASGPDPAGELRQAIARATGPVAVVVDDAELLVEPPVGDVLEQLARTARDHGHLILAAGTTEDLLAQRYRGWLALLRRARCGLLLNPSSYLDGEVFDVRLPRSTAGGWPPGRGLLVRRGETTQVQVPLPSCSPAREAAA